MRSTPLRSCGGQVEAVKINIGFIGLGRISDLHALGYRNSPDARIHSVCTLAEEVGRSKKKEWGAVRFFRDYRDLLADPAIDAVEILTPQPLHEEMVVAAAAAGKHIMVQKPMTIDLDSADRMLAAVKRAGILFKVIENYIGYPPIRKAKELISRGVLGDIQNLRIRFVSGSSGGWEVPDETWAWRMEENRQGRGMQTFDHGHHMWSVARYLLGDIDYVSAWIDSADGVVDCPSSIMWKYKEGHRYGTCDYTHCAQMAVPSAYYANDEWFEISGSRGLLFINRCTGNIKSGPVMTRFDGSRWYSYNNIDDDWSSGFRAATSNFINAIKGRAEPELSGAEAREVLKMALAVIKSSRERRTVFLDEFDVEDPALYYRERTRSEIEQQALGRRGISLDA